MNAVEFRNALQTQQKRKIQGYEYDEKLNRYFPEKSKMQKLVSNRIVLDSWRHCRRFREIGGYSMTQRNHLAHVYGMESRRWVPETWCEGFVLHMAVSDTYMAYAGCQHHYVHMKRNKTNKKPFIRGSNLSQVSSMGWDCDGDTLLVTGMGREQNSGDMTIYGRDRDMRWVLECQKNVGTKSTSPSASAWPKTYSGLLAIGFSGSKPVMLFERRTESAMYCPRTSWKADVTAMCYKYDGRTVCNGLRTGAVWQWDTRSNKINLILPVAKQHRATVDAISVSSDDRALYFSKSDYSLQKFDLRQNKVIVEYVPPRHGSFGKIHHIVDPNECLLYSATKEGKLNSWREWDGKCLFEKSLSSDTAEKTLCFAMAKPYYRHELMASKTELDVMVGGTYGLRRLRMGKSD